MSEIMRPVPFQNLIRWALEEHKNHRTVFGIHETQFFFPPDSNDVEIMGAKCAVPVGPAAGPHTQLAQNILAAYLCGARFMELKTVQEMDGEELRKCVARPCISAADEGYNVEWSTELTVEEAREEYVKAWFLCHIFAKEFNISGKDNFIFNMSAGYSLDGIKSRKIDSFIEGMKNAGDTEIWKNCYDYINGNLHLFERFGKADLESISPKVSNSITLSTLHGCPRDEIEKIALYLLAEKKLHTYIKCNPTLLGHETARKLLDQMGYGHVQFDDHHFKNDLQFDDAVNMLGRLREKAAGQGLCFGVKLTNTFPVKITKNELPGNEMYMSGRALFPLSLTVAKKLSAAFNGTLPVSYSGGADYFNIAAIIKTGIMPVTLATSVLKPGGCGRFKQLAEIALGAVKETAAGGAIINTNALNALADDLPKMERYRREYRPAGAKKKTPARGEMSSPVPAFDCCTAPCSENGCPIHQRIPEYLAAVDSGDYSRAFSIITKDNTAPSVTGTICDHQCQNNCTRIDYDDPLRIRQAKLLAAENAQDAFIESLRPAELKTGRTVAVIGAGPAGIAAAVFLRRNGVPVTVFEKRAEPFGIVRYVIPAFRIPDKAIDRDFRMAKKTGVNFSFNTPEQYSIVDLKTKYDFVVAAAGAWKEGPAVLKEGQESIIDSLTFLEDAKESGGSLPLGASVAVIGGGDVAMDCARAAARNKGVRRVAIVYRRGRDSMPSQREEQEAALADGVEFMELLSPESCSGGVLRCDVMRYDDAVVSGRRTVSPTGEKRELAFDTVISAVGARVDTSAFTAAGIALNGAGLPDVKPSGESSIPGVYIIGDSQSGPATVVKAIAGAKAAAADILCKMGLQADFSAETAGSAPARGDSAAGLYAKKGIIAEAKNGADDCGRCLSCDSLCEICVDVCPNRANAAVETEAAGGVFAGLRQVVHIDRNCNECGNCAVFCPRGGKPYAEKPTVFLCGEDFSSSENPGFLKTAADTYLIRLEDKSAFTWHKGEPGLPDTWAALINTIEEKYSYLF